MYIVKMYKCTCTRTSALHRKRVRSFIQLVMKMGRWENARYKYKINILFNDAFFIRFYGNALCVDICLKLFAGDCVRQLKMRCSNTKDGILLSKKSTRKNRTSADRKTKLISMPPCREHRRFYSYSRPCIAFVYLSLTFFRMME